MDSSEHILNFSFPEVQDKPFRNDPSTYGEVLKTLIKSFVRFMIKYVKDNDPVDMQLILEFLRRMAYLWGNYSDSALSPDHTFEPKWDAEMTMPVSSSPDEASRKNEAAKNMQFWRFSTQFYNAIATRCGNPWGNLWNCRYDIMHDLNQLISIVLLDGYNRPTNPRDEVSQLGHSRLASPYMRVRVKNMPDISLFRRLALFIIKHHQDQDLMSKINDTAVDQAVDRAVSDATKLEQKKSVGRRTRRHKRSGHKRSGKSVHKRNGHKSRRR
jgi:hypothetical protein